jgi:hypothetical protein
VICHAALSPNGWSMPEDEALPEVAARHKFCEAVFNTLNNFLFSEKSSSNVEYGTG